MKGRAREATSELSDKLPDRTEKSRTGCREGGRAVIPIARSFSIDRSVPQDNPGLSALSPKC